jgi:NAD(P)-dependent dehydrogenase (short-subunit alcohol dehydrogenase family)
MTAVRGRDTGSSRQPTPERLRYVGIDGRQKLLGEHREGVVELRSAVVVGGGSGIGAAVAASLAAAGHAVTVADPGRCGGRACGGGLGEGHRGEQADVTSEASVEALLAGVEGPLDVVVNCAGVSTIGLVTDLAVEEFRRVVDVDLTGGFVVLKHAGRLVRDGGSIVTIASLNARQPAAGMARYCAAKAGLAMLVQVRGAGARARAVSGSTRSRPGWSRRR